MGDMRKFFNPAALDDRALGNIEFVLGSPAYEEAFKPYLESIRDSMQRQWLDRSQARKDEYPDDFLAGGVSAIEGLLKLFKLLIDQTSLERVTEAMAGMTSEKQYAMRVEQGRVKPIVGVDQSAVPAAYDPDEDY